MTRKELKIGRYTKEEIFQYMTDVEGSMLGRSMYDAIFNTIHALITERDQLKKDKKTLQKHCRTAEKLQRENKSLKDQVTYLRRSVERKEKQIADWQSDYVLAQSKIDKAIEFINNDDEYTDNDFEGRRFQKDLLQILERTDK